MEELRHLFIFPPDDSEVVEDRIALRRRHDARGRTNKQRKPQLLFDLFDGMAEIGLGNIQISGRLAEGAGIRNFQRVKKLFNFHKQSSAYVLPV